MVDGDISYRINMETIIFEDILVKEVNFILDDLRNFIADKNLFCEEKKVC